MNKFQKKVNDYNIFNTTEKGAYSLEIYNKQDKGYIEVWLTNEEQQMYDRAELTELLLSKVNVKKCRVVFFLSGEGDLLHSTENLLIKNLWCARSTP